MRKTKKQETGGTGINLIESFQEFKQFKNVDRATMMSVLEDVFRSMIRRRFNTDEKCDVILNPDNGDLEIWRSRKVMEDGFSEDDDIEIEISDAKKIDPEVEVGEDLIEKISLESFGRRSILAARQTLVSRIMELEKDSIFQAYKDRVGDVVVGVVHQVWKKELLVRDDDGNDLTLLKSEQIPTDFYKKGDTIRAVVLKVDMQNNNPKVLLSRISPMFLQRLLENEVPEIQEGLISIKKVVREPGERAKVAVESHDPRIDPIGACVGVKGSRIQGIVRELKNESIDIVQYSSDMSEYLIRALNPAQITSVTINSYGRGENVKHTASVYLAPEQVSLLIGKGGFNIKLASKLTELDIEAFKDGEVDTTEDVDLDEFADEIDPWVIDVFKGIGCDTAKSVLVNSFDDLVKRTDLEEETVAEVISILKKEFED